MTRCPHGKDTAFACSACMWEEAAHFVVRDIHGYKSEPMPKAEAQEYANLWDRDCPDDAPHTVEST